MPTSTLAWVNIWLLLLVGCGSELPMGETPGVPPTFGEEVYRIVCGRLAAEALPHDVDASESGPFCRGESGAIAAPSSAMAVLDENRDRLIDALNETVPPDLTDDLDAFFLRLLPIYDPPAEVLPTHTRALADALQQWAADPDATASLARLSAREGYAPLTARWGPLHALSTQEDLSGSLRPLLANLEQQEASTGAKTAWLRSLALELASVEEASSLSSRTGTLRDLLFYTDAAFTTGRALHLTNRDARGLAIPRVLLPPFYDGDADGFADIDDLGRFVDRDRQPFTPPTPYPVYGDNTDRDEFGRALGGDGVAPLYTSTNLDSSWLGALLRELRPLNDPESPSLLQLFRALPPLLGPRQTQRAPFGRTELTFNGFDLRQAAALEVAHALTETMNAPETAGALQTSSELLRRHEPEIAGLIDSMLRTSDIADLDDAALAAGSDFWDDTITVASWISAEPGLTEALLRALADPRVGRLGQVFADMMRFTQGPSLSSTDINASLADTIFTGEVDPRLGDNPSNRSLFQNSMAVIHELNGVRMCNKAGAQIVLDVAGTTITLPGSYDECELLEIPDVAYEYARSIIGEAELEIKPRALRALFDIIDAVPALRGFTADSLLEDQSGIDGLTTSPTPQAINRLVFGEPNAFIEGLIDPPLTRDGLVLRDVYPAVPLSWERTFYFCDDIVLTPTQRRTGGCPESRLEEVSFFDAMTPLIRAFVDNDRLLAAPGITPGSFSSRFLFTELVSAMALHWPEPGAAGLQSSDPDAPGFRRLSGARRYEAIMANSFGECIWTGGRCTEPGAGLFSRLQRLTATLGTVRLSDGRDGYAALADAVERYTDPAQNPDLRARDGARTTVTNSGTRVLPLSPILLILDALGAAETAIDESSPERQNAWAAGRDALSAALLTPECEARVCSMPRRRILPLLAVALAFGAEQIESHDDDGDLSEWSRNLFADLEAMLGSPLTASSIDILDQALLNDEVTTTLSRFIESSLGEEARPAPLDGTLLALADAWQLLEDDSSWRPIARILSVTAAPSALTTVQTGEPLSSAPSVLSTALEVAREATQADESNAIARLISGMVQPPSSQSANETPLEAMLSVYIAANRAETRNDGPLSADEVAALLTALEATIRDERRGIERLYRIIQSRAVAP